jgi:hypothetical protein
MAVVRVWPAHVFRKRNKLAQMPLARQRSARYSPNFHFLFSLFRPNQSLPFPAFCALAAVLCARAMAD